MDSKVRFLLLAFSLRHRLMNSSLEWMNWNLPCWQTRCVETCFQTAISGRQRGVLCLEVADLARSVSVLPQGCYHWLLEIITLLGNCCKIQLEVCSFFLQWSPAESTPCRPNSNITRWKKKSHLFEKVNVSVIYCLLVKYAMMIYGECQFYIFWTMYNSVTRENSVF